MASLKSLTDPIAEKTLASLNDLPEPIAESLLLFLDGDDLIRCGAVCSKWYQKINDMDCLWKEICLLEGITAEDHDWDLTDEWKLFRKPCYWKRIYLNFMKLSYNLREGVCCKIEFPQNCLWSADIKAYNGETLVTTDSLSFNIFKVKDKTVEYKQTIFCKDIETAVTNTAYIVVERMSLLWIYKLTANIYVLDSILHLDTDGGIICYTKMADIPSTFYEVNAPDIVCILNNTLYLRTGAILQAWDINNKICLLNAACGDIVHDAHSVYVYFGNKITAYDADCNVKYSENVEFMNKMFLVCNKLIVIYVVTHAIDITVFCIWNKKTGVLIQKKEYAITPRAVFSVFNHNRSLIMLCWEQSKDLFAYDLEKELYLWNIETDLDLRNENEIRFIPKGISIWGYNTNYGENETNYYSTMDGRTLNIEAPLQEYSNNIIVEKNKIILYR